MLPGVALTGDGDRELKGEGVCINPPFWGWLVCGGAEVGPGPGTSAYTRDSHCSEVAMALKADILTNMCSAVDRDGSCG